MGIQVVELDVLQESSIVAAVEAVREATGGSLDYLVNNAGAAYPVAVLDAKLATAKRLFDVNFWAVIAVTQAFAPLLKVAQGTVLNISSAATKINIPFMGIYAASKAALESVSDAMRLELRVAGISTVIVETASVKTRIFENTDALDIPPTSYHAPHKAEIEKLRGSPPPDSIDADVFAKIVASKALKSNKPIRIWAGGSAGMGWFVSTFLPTSSGDWLAVKILGFGPYLKYKKA
jgi:NAD(P)-dependent dehydrogenase (short-subunit alcohol dehydrogenase family)